MTVFVKRCSQNSLADSADTIRKDEVVAPLQHAAFHSCSIFKATLNLLKWI